MTARRLTPEQQLRRELLITTRRLAVGRSRRQRRLIAACIARRGWRR